MALRFFCLIIGLWLAGPCFSQKKKQQVLNDFSVSLHEEAINKVLLALGDIRGTNSYEVMLINGTYTWTIRNPKINIRPDSSSFTCDALVNVSLFDYKTKVVGDVKINYDNDENLIYVKISRAIFELYTIIFGKKVHIKDIHLEDYFKEPFAFEGPRTITTTMEMAMPDSTKKKIFIQPTECRMELKWKEICTACEISALEVAAPAIIHVTPPIEAIPASTLDAIKTGTVAAPGQKK
jgi:hypothetical protein